MPRARVEKVISDNGITKTVEVEVGERDIKKYARYSVPSTAKATQELVLNLSDSPDGGTFGKSLFGSDWYTRDGKDVYDGETPLAMLHRLFVASVDKLARAAVYESLAQESTFISVAGERVDIMEFPLARLIRGINRMRGEVEDRAELPGMDREKVEKSIGFGPWRTAAKKLAEQGKATENSASGMLEAV